MREHSVRLETGRKLLVREDGKPDGIPVFSLHGTPGCRLMPNLFTDDAATKGIRLISYDRPGYGGSTPAPGRRVVDVASDVAAIADELGLEKFGVWGVSGGGAPALACAAALPKRVLGAASLAGFAPYGADGLDYFAGMGELNIAEFQLMLKDRPAWEAMSRQARDALIATTPDQLRDRWSSLLSEVDRKSLTEEVVAWLISGIKEGLRTGDAGLRDDSLSLAMPWGFDLREIHVPVQIWHGGQDRFVPFSHGQWLAARIPGADVHLEPDEGHLTIVFRHLPDVEAWLASKC